MVHGIRYNNLANKQSKLIQRQGSAYGTGCNFVYLSIPSGYTLLQATLWNTSDMGIILFNKLTDTQYMLVLNEVIPTSLKLDIEYCYV